jgi:hypothetical protein
MTRYELGDAPRWRRAHQWLPLPFSEAAEKILKIIDAHLAEMTPAEQETRLAAARAFLKTRPPWRGRTVPGFPCTRTKPNGFGSWEEWRRVPGVAGGS